MARKLTHFGRRIDLLHFKAWQDLGDVTPLVVTDRKKIFLQLRSIDDGAVPGVELHVPSIETNDRLTHLGQIRRE